MMATGGRCCSGLLQEGDYCVNSYIYTTVAATGGTKYFYCDRDIASNCYPSNTYTMYMSSSVVQGSGTVSASKTCSYTFSTTDIAAAQSTQAQSEAYASSWGQIMIKSATASNTTFLIYTIDKDSKATRRYLDQIIDVNYQSLLLIASMAGSSQTYTMSYGYDVQTAVYGASTTSSAKYFQQQSILELAFVFITSVLLLTIN
eukprot:403365105